MIRIFNSAWFTNHRECPLPRALFMHNDENISTSTHLPLCNARKAILYRIICQRSFVAFSIASEDICGLLARGPSYQEFRQEWVERTAFVSVLSSTSFLLAPAAVPETREAVLLPEQILKVQYTSHQCFFHLMACILSHQLHPLRIF